MRWNLILSCITIFIGNTIGVKADEWIGNEARPLPEPT
jgi:hypothetical protein